MGQRLVWLFLGLVLAANAARAENDLAPRLLQIAEARSFDAETLLAAAESRELVWRKQAARLAGFFRQESAVRVALRLARDPHPEVRAEAVVSLGRLAPWLFQQSWHARVRKALSAALSDPSAVVREAAAWAWAAAGQEDTVLLEAASRERDISVRAAILRELWRTSGNQWPAVAWRSTKAAQPQLRWAALWSLTRKGGGELASSLAELLRDPDPQVRLLACEAVRRHRLSSFAAAVAGLLADAEEEVRVAAMNALAELGSAAAPAVTGKTLRDLSEIIATDNLEHPHLRVAAVRLAGTLGCCRDALTSLLEEGGWAGGEALLALARQGLRQPVEQELASPDPAFRRWAVLALPYVTQGQELLVRALADPEPSVRLAAAEVAGKEAFAPLASELVKLLADADGAVRVQAAESLYALGQPPDPSTLAKLLQQELAGVPSEAAVSLVRLLGKPETLTPEAASALEKARSSRFPAVALAAWEELFRHGRFRGFPQGSAGKPLALYQDIERFAEKPRYWEVVTVRGTFTVALDTEEAPITTYTLCQLADKKFYDNLTFHRVVSNFVVQGGDPRGDGWGGPGFFLPDELSRKPFTAGSVGMALAGPDTGGSQFFVTLTEQPHLSGRYPRVGAVASGFDVVRRLQVGDRILRIRCGEGAPPVPVPVWYGPLAVEKLEREIPEFRQNRESYQPQEQWLSFLRKATSKYTVVVAMGTWCSDSREQVPRLLKIHEVLGQQSPFSQITLLGVDRGKKVVPHTLFPFGLVERVPTIVVTFGGAEVGRVVETPLAPTLEEDLVRILAPLEGWELPEAEPK
uniref:peptidylprolyl isomerase n=1 Tax=uncultured prokaryote TaxID=198431 RepID=H5SKV4_9ZZZZ|nr:peptidyl-prolyl cis-trans isomerase, cyclophilin-type domain protein [uncultured prokaryote]